MYATSQWRDYRKAQSYDVLSLKLQQELAYGEYRIGVLRNNMKAPGQKILPGDCVVQKFPDTFLMLPIHEAIYRIESKEKDGFTASILGNPFDKVKGLRFGSGIAQLPCDQSEKLVSEIRLQISQREELKRIEGAARELDGRLWLKPNPIAAE